jgi:hypothetical protein
MSVAMSDTKEDKQILAQVLMSELQVRASDADAVFLQRFFKTGKGEYGAGDVFIGVRVPMTRKICKDFMSLPIHELGLLLDSPVHEHRLAATIIMSAQYKKASPEIQEKLYQVYMAGLENHQINNWDIVDTSCEHILGRHAHHMVRRFCMIWRVRAIFGKSVPVSSVALHGYARVI